MELTISRQTRTRVIEPRRAHQSRRPLPDTLSALKAQQAEAWAAEQRLQILQRNITNAFVSGRW